MSRAGEVWEAPFGTIYLVLGEDAANSHAYDGVCHVVCIVPSSRPIEVGRMTGVWLPREDDGTGDWNRLA